MLSDDERERLVALSTLVVRCRSAVDRDSYRRDVELIPDAEAPTRLIVVLARLLQGLDAIGVDKDAAWGVVTGAALDSVPALRRKVLTVLYGRIALESDASAMDTTAIAVAVDYPTQTVRRALEDMAAHKVVRRNAQGQGKASQWSLEPWAVRNLAAGIGVPEKSAGALG